MKKKKKNDKKEEEKKEKEILFFTWASVSAVCDTTKNPFMLINFHVQ